MTISEIVVQVIWIWRIKWGFSIAVVSKTGLPHKIFFYLKRHNLRKGQYKKSNEIAFFFSFFLSFLPSFCFWLAVCFVSALALESYQVLSFAESFYLISPIRSFVNHCKGFVSVWWVLCFLVLFVCLIS